MNESQPPPLPADAQVSGFWRRLLALVVDEAILSVPAVLLGFLFFEQFAKLGGWGRAVGFIVALFYFGLMNSTLGGGQTLGKRLMKVRVVNGSDSPISVARSFLRFLILGAPFFLNGAAFPPSWFTSWIGVIIGIAIFGIGGSIIYLFIFNRRSRRTLHDLIVGTYVLKTTSPSGVPKPKTWGGHYVVIGLLFCACAVAPIFLKRLAEKPLFKDIVSLQSTLLAQPNVWSANVISGSTVFWGPSGKALISATTMNVRVDSPIDNYDAFVNNISRLLFQNYPELANRDRVIVNVIYAYDLGIARGSVGRNYNFSPAEWQQRIGR